MRKGDKKLHALLQLLDDNDPNVYKAVEEELKMADISVLPVIEEAITYTQGNSQQERLENIISHLRFRKTEESIINWAQSDNNSLLKGWYLASCLHYYDLEFDSIEKEVQKIVKDVWLEINDSLTSIEKTSILNHILFNTYKYDIDSDSSYEPGNFFINNVIKNKKGNQLSVAILYHIIAKRLLLPIFPIYFKSNYLLGYYDPAVSAEAFGNDAPPFLFYINPGHKGTIIGAKEMDYYLKKDNIEFEKFFMLSKESTIIKQLFFTLQRAYSAKGQNQRAIQAKNLHKQLD